MSRSVIVARTRPSRFLFPGRSSGDWYTGGSRWNVNVPDDRIKVKVDRGWVRLDGSVDARADPLFVDVLAAERVRR